MFFGVLHKRNATRLWNMLYFQALFWILAATFTELPSVVCLFTSNAVQCPSFTHCASSHRHWVLKTSTVSLSRACLKCLSNRPLYPTDPWNMVSNTRCFPFLVAQGILNRCSNTRIVCSSPHPVGPTNLYTCITLASVTLVYARQLASDLGSFIFVQGNHVLTGISRSLPIYHGVGLLATLRSSRC